ncbi:AAA family ATPase [Alloalcanivorax sp. C16-1]|uniref:AAA family ATPase n=1 Tax=Alloalcanivorax sp. C16-1 TaxID=3390051 RepID=UPI0039709DBE
MGFSWPRAPRELAEALLAVYGAPETTGHLAGNLLSLLAAGLVFWLAARLGRRARAGLLALHDRVLRLGSEKRWLWNLSRLVAGLAPLLPWLILAALLALATPLLATSPATRWVFLALPLAWLYVLFGVQWLAGEWLVLRVAQAAGEYVQGDQAQTAGLRARRLSQLLLVPWALFLVAAQAQPQGAMHTVLAALVAVSLYAAVARLLAPRAREYVLCLQSILPSSLDPLAERLLRPRWFHWTAPLLLPVALVYFVTRYLDRLFAGFDGYLRLKARWFRLRNRGDEDEDGAPLDESEAARAYQSWFAAELPGDEPAPFIDTGLEEAIAKAVQRWRDDRSDDNTLLVTGEKGSGKSLTVAHLSERLAESDPALRVVRLAVPPRTVAPQAVTALVAEALNEALDEGPASLVRNDSERPPTLLVLDECQNTFLSRIGGLDGWRALLRLTNARLDNLFWLVLINNQSWAYLCNVFGREYQFRNMVRVKRWSPTEIRSLILSRHHRSGLKLRYDEVLLSSRGPEAGNVRNAEQRYFSLLWDACRGNPMTALKLWLSSVKVGRREVLVGLPSLPPSAAVEKSGENLLFVYAAIATHENLSGDEIVTVTNLPENVVRYALKAGFDAGFIRSSEDDGRYRLVPLWYHTVIHLLTRKNLLHE